MVVWNQARTTTMASPVHLHGTVVAPGRAAPPRRSQPGMGDAADARRRLATSRADDPGPGCRCRPSGLSPRGSGNPGQHQSAPCWRTAMTPPSKSRWDRSAHYQIVVRGELSDRFAHAFPEMTLQPEAGYTRITGVIVDQSHLHGILEGLRSFGIDLVSVNEVVRASTKLSKARPRQSRSRAQVPRITTPVHQHARSTATCGDSRERSGVEVMQRPHLFGVDIERTGGAEGPGSRPDVWRVRAAEHQLRPGRDVVPSFAKIAGRRARRTPAASMPRHSHASPMKGSRLSSE